MILRHHGTMEPRRHAEPRCQPESNQTVVWVWLSADLARPLSISFGVSPLDGMSWRRTAISHGSLDRGPHVRRMDSGRCGPLRRKRTRRGRSLNQPGRRRVETPQRRRRRIGLPGLRTKQWPGQCGRGGDDWIGWCRAGGMTSAAPRGLQLTGGTVCVCDGGWMICIESFLQPEISWFLLGRGGWLVDGQETSAASDSWDDPSRPNVTSTLFCPS